MLTTIKTSMIVSLVAILYAMTGQADEPRPQMIHSRTYGTWSPPPKLFSFWKGMKDVWWNPEHADVKKLNSYFTKYTKTHDVQELMPEIFEDLKLNWDELRVAMYSALVRYWNRQEVKLLLNRYDSYKKGTSEHQTAEDFIADIEEVERDSNKIPPR